LNAYEDQDKKKMEAEVDIRALCQLPQWLVCELAKQLRSVAWSVAALPTHHTALWGVGKTYFLDRNSALCQLTRRMVCELAKQLRIRTVVSGGFANSSHRVLQRVGKTYAVDGGKTYIVDDGKTYAAGLPPNSHIR
jgi:hypothetical protein